MALDFDWQDGDRVMFLGDSGTDDPQSYTRLVPAMVTARYPERQLDYLPRGIGGDRIDSLLRRLDADVFRNDLLPTWIVLSVGTNDVWHGGSGTPLGRFHELYHELLLRLADTKATVLCLTTTVIGEELENPQNQALTGYNDAIRAIAFEHGAQVVDVNTVLREAITRAQARNPDFRFTIDNIRLGIPGNYLVAMTLLGTLHFALPA